MTKSEKKQGSRKAPRKHDPKWKDNTRAERIAKRRQRLNEIAKENGFESWSAFETAVLNGVASLTKRPPDKGGLR